MKISSFGHFTVDALKSIRRNKAISFAAMVTVLVTFFVFGTFMLLGSNFNNAIKDIVDKVEIRVNLIEGIKLVEQKEIEIKLKEQPGIKEITYVTKEEAFKQFKEDLGENQGILEGYSIENNPLPSYFVVTLTDASYANDVSKSVREMLGVEDITNQQELIENISYFVEVIKVMGAALFILFTGISIFLIMNTIKITVYSRRREVGIMKFVGATDWFIRWPFVIEGIIIGAVGSMFASFILYGIYKSVYNWIIQSMFVINLVEPTFVLTTLMGLFIGGGVIVGAIGSIAALRKFLIV